MEVEEAQEDVEDVGVIECQLNLLVLVVAQDGGEVVGVFDQDSLVVEESFSLLEGWKEPAKGDFDIWRMEARHRSAGC